MFFLCVRILHELIVLICLEQLLYEADWWKVCRIYFNMAWMTKNFLNRSGSPKNAIHVYDTEWSLKNGKRGLVALEVKLHLVVNCKFNLSSCYCYMRVGVERVCSVRRSARNA